MGESSLLCDVTNALAYPLFDVVVPPRAVNTLERNVDHFFLTDVVHVVMTFD